MKNKTKLAFYRKQRGYSQSDIANLLGCTVSAYSKYENGDREPSIKGLISLADFYQISVDDIIGHIPLKQNLQKQESIKNNQVDVSIEKVAKYKQTFDIEKAKCLNNSLVFKLITDFNVYQDCSYVNDIYRFIDFLLTISNEKVVDLIDIFKVSSSGYYHWKEFGDVVKKRNESIAELIKQYEFAALDSAGYSAVTAYLRTLLDRTNLQNISVARVKRIMDEFDIIPEDLRAKKNKLILNVVGKYNASKLPFANNILKRQFNCNIPSCKVWCIDITEIKTDEGKLYLCALIDLCGRYLIGYALSKKMDMFIVKKAIRKAKENAEKYKNISEQAFIIHSDESFFSSLKCEYLYRFNLSSFSVATNLVERYIKFYNNIRVHQTIMDIPFRYWIER